MGLVWTPGGPQVRVRNLRIHHGLAGAVVVVLGIVAMWHDRGDRWWSVHDGVTQ